MISCSNLKIVTHIAYKHSCHPVSVRDSFGIRNFVCSDYDQCLKKYSQNDIGVKSKTKILMITFILFLFNIPVNALSVENYLKYRAGLEEYNGDVKCATQYDFQVKIQSQNLHDLLKLIPLELVRSDSIITTHFTLHWDETGNHAVPAEDLSNNGTPDYIDSAAVFLEYVWDVEINQMNYTPPPQQNGQPVSTYHIYFTNMPYYGLTTGSGVDIPSLPGLNWTSYIELENDYQENYFNTKGLDGLRVTAAHEFHHAIEFGYNVRQNDFFFYEMTATWLEDVLYTEINDYYNYLSTFFNGLGFRSFDDFSNYAYGNCLYQHMVAKQYGVEFIKEVWDEIRSHPAIDAIKTTLAYQEYRSTWIKSLSDYGIWLYFTGNRANPEQYFTEGEFYPQLKLNNSNIYQFSDSLSFTSEVLSNAFKYFKVFGVEDKALQSSIDSDIAQNAGHTLFSLTDVSEFTPVPDTLNGFVTGEDSMLILIANGENFSDNFKVETKLLQNFVKIDSLIVYAKEGRNILLWSSLYEILNREWKISRKKQGGTFEIIYKIAGQEYSTSKLQYTFVDENLEEGQAYQYKLDAVFLNDTSQSVDSVMVNSLAPVKFNLIQNYPNPFNNETSIIVEVLYTTELSLIVYNTLGQKIKTLQEKKYIQPGFHPYLWKGDSDRSKNVSSGVYFIVLVANGQSKQIKAVYIK